MNSKKKIVIFMILFMLLFAGAGILYARLGKQYAPDSLVTENQEQGNIEEQEEDEAEQKTQNPAPDFSVTDLAGNEVKLSQFEGKPVVLNFWASWCGPCKSEMPDFETAYQKYKEEIHFVMVNLTDGTRETVEIASTFVKGQGYTFPVYFDTQSDAANTYQVYSVPTSYFIDADGNLIAWAQGMINGQQLEKGIQMILGAE